MFSMGITGVLSSIDGPDLEKISYAIAGVFTSNTMENSYEPLVISSRFSFSWNESLIYDQNDEVFSSFFYSNDTRMETFVKE
jgi:hypothetical protein